MLLGVEMDLGEHSLSITEDDEQLRTEVVSDQYASQVDAVQSV